MGKGKQENIKKCNLYYEKGLIPSITTIFVSQIVKETSKYM